MDLFVMILWTLISLLVLAAVIRYAIDSSKTSKKLTELVEEVQYLRKEIKKQNENNKIENNHIIDKRV